MFSCIEGTGYLDGFHLGIDNKVQIVSRLPISYLWAMQQKLDSSQYDATRACSAQFSFSLAVFVSVVRVLLISFLETRSQQFAAFPVTARPPSCCPSCFRSPDDLKACISDACI